MMHEDWEFNVLGVDNYNKSGKLKYYFDFIKKNHNNIEGDIIEAGVFNGLSILGTGLLLKELGSLKKVYGFDTFSGFPPIYHKFDQLDQFNVLFKNNEITKNHYDRVKKNILYKSILIDEKVNVKNISTSGDFSKSNLEILKKKIDFLKLDNIELIQGRFESTMNKTSNRPKKVMAALVDCDLYMSYKLSLPFIWSRLSQGGYVYLDEYYSLKFPGGKIATDEFFKDKKSKPFEHPTEESDFERWAVLNKG
jgi:hypothetical protein